MYLKPRSHNWATDNRLKFKLSTSSTLEMLKSLDIAILPRPLTLPLPLSPNVILSIPLLSFVLIDVTEPINYTRLSNITVQVFHQYYYDEVAQVKCSLSSERWWFESIINQLVVIPRTNLTHPLKWGVGHRVNHSGEVASLLGTTCTRAPPDCSLALSSRPRILPLLLRYSALRAIHSARIIS
jgi:hypothetical protein